MTDITKQTEDELRATIANAQARLKEIEDSKKKTFSGSMYELRVEESHDGFWFAIHDRKTGVLKSDIHKLIVWLGERLGGQAPQEPCEVCKHVELVPFKERQFESQTVTGEYKGTPFIDTMSAYKRVHVEGVLGPVDISKCDNVREVKIKQ